MLTYVPYSEAGGVGKTTLAANLGVAHARAGHRTLLIDLDPQDGCLSYLLGAEEYRAAPDADNLVRHMVDRPQGPFEDLVTEVESGAHLVPSHNMLERLHDLLTKAADLEEGAHPDPDYEYPRHEQLFRVLQKTGVHDRYDVLVIDPPATAGPHLYNALHATRNVLIPLELSGKGERSIEGLRDLVENLEVELGIGVGVLGVVPNGVKNTNHQKAYREEIEAAGYPVPVTFRDRTSLFEGCWVHQCSAFRFIDEHRSRKRDYELETLEKIEDLARYLEAQVGLSDHGEMDNEVGVEEVAR